MSDGRPFRLAFLLRLDSDLSPAAAYRQAIDLFVPPSGSATTRAG
ncbi:hypothetical protein [Streptomyces sp. NPDC001508]